MNRFFFGYEAVDLFYLCDSQSREVNFCLKNFKWPKNREDSSDFDDFQTKRIVSAQPIFQKFSKEVNEGKYFEKF